MLLMRLGFCLLAAVICLSCGAAPAHADAPLSPSVTFLVTLHIANEPDSDYFDLDDPNSSFDITLKNVSSVSQKVAIDPFSPFGVAISAINGTTLTSPCGLAARPVCLAAYVFHPRTLKPGEEMIKRIFVRDLQPRFMVFPGQDNRLIDGRILPRLAGNNSSRFETITVEAYYMVWRQGSRIAETHGYKLLSQSYVSAPVTIKTAL